MQLQQFIVVNCRMQAISHRLRLMLSTAILQIFYVAASDLSANVSFLDAARGNSRQRRYLIFEKGSTVFIQGNIAKAILGTTPRGLNEISEWTWTYDLPASIESLWPKERRLTTPKPTQLSLVLPFNSCLHYWHQPHRLIHAQSQNRKWLKQARKAKTRIRCRKSMNKLKKYPQDASRYESASRFLFDFLKKWGEMHGYAGRYCIMRTLCESHHLLLPHGSSLFHDFVRILLRYAYSLFMQQPTYRAAYTNNHTLLRCQTLYGPHCRISFLEHFAELFHV